MKKDKKQEKFDESESQSQDVVSMTECTGLMPSLIDTKAEEASIKDIYDIP